MATTPLPIPLPEPEASPRPVRPAPGADEGPPRSGGPHIASARIAVVMLLVGETMLFTGLLGAYFVLRFGSVVWPPAGEPRLPLAITSINTALLFASAWTMRLAVRAARARETEPTTNALGVTAFLGVIFLAVQGSEWVRLLSHGLTLSSSTYGGTFYLLIGVHGAHVFAAVAWLASVFALARRRAGALRPLTVELCALYWNYVVALWAVLFGLVYLL